MNSREDWAKAGDMIQQGLRDGLATQASAALHHVHVFVAIDGGEPVKVGTTSVNLMAPEGVSLAVAEIGTALTRDVATRALDFDDTPPAWHPNVGDQVRVTIDGERLRGLMAHHSGRTGRVTAVYGGGPNPGRRLDVMIPQLGIVTFNESELEQCK